MFCALSGEAPEVPVVTKSGQFYERRLIEKYIAENGTDPITGERLAADDLIVVKTSPKGSAPRPPSMSSIPAILHTLQNEWDALVLEQFTLRERYNAVRQELSHALYQHDAATRVAARLLKERDSAREALASVQATMGIASAPAAAVADVEMEAAPQEQSGALPADADAEIVETQAALSAIRKKKAKPAATYATPAQVRGYTSKHTVTSLHASSPAGINALAVSSANPSQFLTGGNDKIVQIYDRESNKILSTLKGHTKKVNHVAWREREGDATLVMGGSADKTVRIWSHDAASNEYAPAHTVKLHKGEITGLAVHPTAHYVGISSADKTYSLHSLSTFQSIYQSPVNENPYTALSIHPDGHLLGLGTARATVQIYDVRTGQMAMETLQPAELSAESSAYSVHTISFSENGYHLACPDSPSSLTLWDLRKPKVLHVLPLATADGSAYKINRVKYDLSAQFIGVAGSDLRIIANKNWEELAKFEGGEVTDFVYGSGANEIWSSSGREVKIWGPSG
ncbi:nuclear matrix protein NMP200 [Clavulina sp. PMI_390]|nr:nuclear matrix protein NMP200 [Clavulina sp. PMI_390]